MVLHQPCANTVSSIYYGYTDVGYMAKNHIDSRKGNPGGKCEMGAAGDARKRQTAVATSGYDRMCL